MAQKQPSPAKAGQSNAAATAGDPASGQAEPNARTNASGKTNAKPRPKAGGGTTSQASVQAAPKVSTTASPKAAPKASAKADGKASAKARPMAAAQSALGLSLARQRELAKVGMTVSLAVLVVTGFTGAHKRGPSRTLHLASGATLVGFSLWHHCLYGKPAAKPQENNE